MMAKITLEPKQRFDIEELKAEAKLARKHPSKEERVLQRLINKGPWRWRLKKVWGREIYDLWCSVLYIGVQIVPDPPGPTWIGERTMVLSFSPGEVLGEPEMVAQIIEQAAASQHAWLRALRA